MSVSAVSFRVGLVLVHLGAALSLLGAWSNASEDPGGGANIGAGIAILVGTPVFVLGVLCELVSLVWWVSTRASRTRGAP